MLKSIKLFCCCCCCCSTECHSLCAFNLIKSVQSSRMFVAAAGLNAVPSPSLYPSLVRICLTLCGKIIDEERMCRPADISMAVCPFRATGHLDRTRKRFPQFSQPRRLPFFVFLCVWESICRYAGLQSCGPQTLRRFFFLQLVGACEHLDRWRMSMQWMKNLQPTLGSCVLFREVNNEIISWKYVIYFALMHQSQILPRTAKNCIQFSILP